MREKTIKLYEYDELPNEKAKERARDWFREGALDYDWWDFIYDDFERIATALGYSISERTGRSFNTTTKQERTYTEKKIWFSGFYSSGDGACFEGTWNADRVQNLKALEKQLGNLNKHPDKELVRIARGLRDLARKHKTLYASLEHRDRYCYARTVAITCEELKTDRKGEERDVLAPDTQSEFEELSWNLMDWLFNNLREEHDYRLSDEAVEDDIRANNYTFTEDGERED